jgi:hypothetical protein
MSSGLWNPGAPGWPWADGARAALELCVGFVMRSLRFSFRHYSCDVGNPTHSFDVWKLACAVDTAVEGHF